MDSKGVGQALDEMQIADAEAVQSFFEKHGRSSERATRDAFVTKFPTEKDKTKAAHANLCRLDRVKENEDGTCDLEIENLDNGNEYTVTLIRDGADSWVWAFAKVELA